MDPRITALNPDGHAHRWHIEEPNGPTSRGVCRVCEAQREFRNWLEDQDFSTNEEYRLAA
jgi:hypothetical protein